MILNYTAVLNTPGHPEEEDSYNLGEEPVTEEQLLGLAEEIAKAYMCNYVFDWEDEEEGLASFDDIFAHKIADWHYEVVFSEYVVGAMEVTVKFEHPVEHHEMHTDVSGYDEAIMRRLKA